MQAVLNSALPVFALILTGFVCGYFGVFDRVATDNLNRFAVYLALPSLMFVAMSKITPDQVRQFGFVAAFCGGFAVVDSNDMPGAFRRSGDCSRFQVPISSCRQSRPPRMGA